ncbi:MAG TPA: hypothetical protein VHG51_06000, partial [Longimicrobiaceae bacterium]|nr:hypothetical protein [Longimicrobiaceae bacterium]
APRGWRFRPEPGSVSQGGFVASVAGSRSGGTTFCGEGGATLSAVAFPREEGGSYLRITLDRDRRSSYCTAAGTPRPHETADDVPFPELRPPARATVRPRGSGSSSSEGRVTERSSAALVEGSLGAAALAAHYTGEMRRAGWSMAEPVAGEAAALATGSLRDARGRSWRAVLTAVSRSADELDLTLRVLRLEDEES